MASIRRASWNLYELERLRKDLIDMALRAALEHKTLAESLGPGRREIYDDMAREIDPGSFADWLCGLARPYTLWYAVLLLVNMVLGTGRAAAVFLVLMSLSFICQIACSAVSGSAGGRVPAEVSSSRSCCLRWRSLCSRRASGFCPGACRV